MHDHLLLGYIGHAFVQIKYTHICTIVSCKCISRDSPSQYNFVGTPPVNLAL